MANLPSEIYGMPWDDRPTCEFHRGHFAWFRCDRCGVFACAECRKTAGGAELCERCVNPAGVARKKAEKETSPGALFWGALDLFRENLSVVGLVALSFALLDVGHEAVRASVGDGSGLLKGVWVLDIVLTLAALAGFIRWVGDGRRLGAAERSVALALRAAGSRFFFLGLTWGLAVPLVWLGLLLLFMPGFYVATSLALAPAVVVLDGFGPYTALRRSAELMEGYRLKVLGLFAGQGLLWWLGMSMVRGLVSWMGLDIGGRTLTSVELLLGFELAGSRVDYNPTMPELVVRSVLTAGFVCCLLCATVVAYLRILEHRRLVELHSAPGPGEVKEARPAV